MMRVVALTAMLLLTGIAAAPAAAKEQKLVADAHGQISFVMPSNNVDCIYTPQGGTPIYTPANGGPELSCDRAEPIYVNVRLIPGEAAAVTPDPGEQPCCSGDNTFAYGHTTRLGADFLCTSATTGLVCETADKRHGFSISRAKILSH
jgi:hypothetical protein